MMITIIKLLIGICITLLAANIKPKTVSDHEPLAYTTSVTKDPVKTKAFEILTNKCNVCHKGRNRRRVFTEDNMNNWSNDVYKQVFIKKRMPKGKKNQTHQRRISRFTNLDIILKKQSKWKSTLKLSY